MNKKSRSTKSEKWRHTCNSVEIALTNEQKVAVTSYGRNKNHDDEIKKHSRTSPEIQFKELNEKLRRTLPDQQINWTIPARAQTKSSQKIEKLKESKLNKIYSLLKLEAFKPMAIFFPLKIPISKISSKSIFVSEIGPAFYLQDLKNIHWPLKIDD